MLRPDRWLPRTEGARTAAILAGGAALMACVGFLLLRGDYAQREAERQMWRQQQAQRQSRWQSLMPLRQQLAALTKNSACRAACLYPVGFPAPDGAAGQLAA